MIEKEEINQILNDAIYSCALRTVDNDCSAKFLELLPKLESLLADTTIPTEMAEVIMKLILVSRIDEFMDIHLKEILERVKK